MKLRRRLLRLLPMIALALVVLLSGSRAFAQDEHLEEPMNRDCICESSEGACQHFLNHPMGATEDPCWCHKCRTFSQHDGKTVPDGMNPLCFTSARMDCYLKRHAVAWRINCSECVQEEECCKYDDHANCPNCDDDAGNPLASDVFGNPAKETVLDRLEKEKRFFKKNKGVIVAYNRHFYLCTDMKPLKVKKQDGGSYRVVSGHEWVHLMIERAMYARREFTDAFGSSPRMNKPSAMYFPLKERDAAKIQGAYLGSPRTNILYGGSDAGSLADGFAFNGFCASSQKYGDDHDMHMVMRHNLGHLFISCWTVVDGNNRALPRWLFVGTAHWLCKKQLRFRDDVTFCGNETTPISGSGSDWLDDLAKVARKKGYDPIEELFGKTASGQLDFLDHQRSWGYLQLGLLEWNAEFVKVLADIRRQQEPRDTFVKNLNCTPEVFHERWEERLTGKRRSLDPRKSEDEFEGNETPGQRDRKKLLAESDPQKLSALIRGLGTITDPKTVHTVIDLFSKNSELVREAGVVALLKIKDPEILEAMWQYGLAHKKAMPRAYTARACGSLGLEWALPLLREQLEDKNWYARAEAAVACGKLGDIQSMRGLREMVNDSAEKARVGAMDALAMFGEEAEMAVPLMVKHLKSPQWQLRVTACQALGKIGSMEAVEPLIERMEVESGRVRGDIRDALKEITRDDLGRKPEFWRDWWERLKNNTPNGLPKRPDAPPDTGEDDKPDPDDKYAKQEYYGIEIYSSRIGFVLDTSGSMATNFEPDPTTVGRLSRKYTGTNKLTICKEEIAQALKSLDPRSHFNIIAFGTGIKTMKKNPIAASSGNIKSAFGFLRSLPATGETNYYGALRAALDLGETVDASPNFRSTPDTLTFLTDGMPTRGEMTDADTLLEWYTALNRYTRVRTHVIAFGSKGVDLVLLRGMAERNDGKFIHVAEKR